MSVLSFYEIIDITKMSMTHKDIKVNPLLILQNIQQFN